jgi:acyl-CoA thioesterase-1
MVTGPILMIGDSITDAGRPRDTDGLGFGWVKLVADALYGRGVVLNRGIGGDRVADLRARWSHDVVALAPSVLTVLIGINDVAGRYGGAGPVPLGAFDADYRAILTQAFEAAAPGLILMEPFLACAVGDGKAVWHDDLDPKREVVARLAEEFAGEFVPLQALVDKASVQYGAQAVACDGIHPSPLGERLIAEAWLGAYGRLYDWETA